MADPTPLRLERIACPLCGGTTRQTDIAVRADGLHVVRCAECGLAFVNPRPAVQDLARLYGAAYFAGSAGKAVGYSDYHPSVADIKAAPPRAFRLLRADGIDVRGLRTLDVGCAFGQLVYWLARAGATATGIDVSTEAVEFGRRTLGLDLRAGPLEQLAAPDGSFDLITLIDVIEHVPDLAEFLRRVAVLLKPGGRAIVHTPNFAPFFSVGARFKGFHLSLEHLLYFEPLTLETAMAQAGLTLDRPTRALISASPDINEFRAVAARGPSLGDRIRRLPGLRTLRRVRHAWLPPRDRFRFDPTLAAGATLVACFHKPA